MYKKRLVSRIMTQIKHDGQHNFLSAVMLSVVLQSVVAPSIVSLTLFHSKSGYLIGKVFIQKFFSNVCKLENVLSDDWCRNFLFQFIF